jgi:DNA-binding NarL/FixJ family response regulator
VPAIGAEKIQLLIVGEQPAVRKGLHMRLAAESDICVMGEAATCQSALEMAKAMCPDVVLIDVEMPRMNSLAMADALRSICRQAAVIILSIHDDSAARARAEAAGAAAFVAKSMPADTLLAAIRQIVL